MGDLLRVVLGSSASLLPRGSRLTRSLPTPGPDSLGLAPDTTPGLGQQLGGRRVVLGTVGALLDPHKKRSEERRVGKACRSRWSPCQRRENTPRVADTKVLHKRQAREH